MFLQLLRCSASFFIDALISPARLSSPLLFPQLQNLRPADHPENIPTERHHQRSLVTEIELKQWCGQLIRHSVLIVLIPSCAVPFC